jgi:predicted glycosyltransferase involved in capsule biosynthesis
MGRLSLYNIDIVVSYRAATAQRTENLQTVLRHLDYTYRDYRVWLMEADTTPHFEWARLADPRIRHVFVPDGGAFPKALLYNLGARLCNSPVICFHDADCISRPQHLAYCAQRLLTGDGSDEPGTGVGAMCPFQSMFNVNGDARRDFARTPDFAVLDGLELPQRASPDVSLLYPYNVGGVFLFRRQLYMRLGGCNPACTGWGSEDNELFARARRLGVDWQSVAQPMFHLHHDSADRDGYGQSESAQRNKAFEAAANDMPLEDLKSLAARLSRFFQ